jgi:hypothetical protein
MNESNEKPNAELLLAAYEEFHKGAVVGGVKCDRCGQPIVITSITGVGTAFKSDCSCGRYRSTMKGL